MEVIDVLDVFNAFDVFLHHAACSGTMTTLLVSIMNNPILDPMLLTLVESMLTILTRIISTIVMLIRKSNESRLR